jgi:hypothetical protein
VLSGGGQSLASPAAPIPLGRPLSRSRPACPTARHRTHPAGGTRPNAVSQRRRPGGASRHRPNHRAQYSPFQVASVPIPEVNDARPTPSTAIGPYRTESPTRAASPAPAGGPQLASYRSRARAVRRRVTLWSRGSALIELVKGGLSRAKSTMWRGDGILKGSVANFAPGGLPV